MIEPSVFTRIINGEIPAYKIYEDDRVIAFLTNHPLSDGHTLVVPKKQIDQIWDLERDDYDYLWEAAQKVAAHLRDVMGVERVGVVVKGFEVPHAHIHLIPVPRDSRVFFDPEPEPPMAGGDKLAAIAERIRF
ncbi:MAG: HIT domain-containing protein [Candidatus Saccharibacteria bacterium]